MYRNTRVAVAFPVWRLERRQLQREMSRCQHFMGGHFIITRNKQFLDKMGAIKSTSESEERGGRGTEHRELTGEEPAASWAPTSSLQGTPMTQCGPYSSALQPREFWAAARGRMLARPFAFVIVYSWNDDPCRFSSTMLISKHMAFLNPNCVWNVDTTL